MKLLNPFECDGRWFKANLHCHSTASDGEVAPEERIRQYRAQGYDILALTDHRVVHDVSGWSDDKLLVVSGVEDHPAGILGGDTFHLVCLNVPADYAIDQQAGVNERIEAIRAAGGEVILAHPYWCGHNITHVLPVWGYAAVEVFNSTCTKIGKGVSSVVWDDLLDSGRVVGGVAVDDVHRGRDIFMGWTMFKLRERTVAELLAALREGRYYATSGPEIEYFGVQDGRITLRCSPAREIHFVSQRSQGLTHYADDGPLLTEAARDLTENLRYVRGEVVDDRGRRAWTNPIFFTPA